MPIFIAPGMPEKFRIFVEDVGDSAYSASGFDDVLAESMLDAWNQAASLCADWKRKTGQSFIVLPHSRRDLWPDGKTGRLSREAIHFVNSLGGP